ncbi:MAG TPA: serine hydrolase, partial [Bacteroidales bacterium]|nr:serine hydrolase [Bacteroidales bacterium]
DKVIKWLPDFKMRDPWVSQELNLTDILCHRIGMETFQGDFMYWSSNLTPHEIIMKFGQLKPDYGFREKWGYTNAGFLIAGQCIEKISGESWDSNVRKKIFGPLQMGRSVALSAEYPLQKNIATPHTLVFDTLKAIPFPMIDNLAPAGSIGSSVKDMCNWMMCLLNDGEFEGKKVIPASAIQATREPRSIIGKAQPTFNRGNFNLYGLGWDLTDYEGRGIVCHTGGVNGFVTSVTLIPEEKLGIVVLTNTDQNYLYEALKWEILDSYLNLPYRNYSNLYYAYYRKNADKDYLEYKTLRDSVDMQKNKSHDLKRYVGKYSHPVYGGLTITSDKNMLKVKFEHHPNLTAKLEYLSDTRFLCTFNDPIFGNKVWPFKIDQNKVQSLTLKVAEFVEYNGYEFIKQ